MDEQIRRQRELILQMDSHYQKQIQFLKSRIERLQEQIQGGEGPESGSTMQGYEPQSASNRQESYQKPTRVTNGVRPLPKLHPV